MTERMRMFRFRRTLSSAAIALALILGLAGLTGLSSIDLADVFEPEASTLTIAKN